MVRFLRTEVLIDGLPCIAAAIIKRSSYHAEGFPLVPSRLTATIDLMIVGLLSLLSYVTSFFGYPSIRTDL